MPNYTISPVILKTIFRLYYDNRGTRYIALVTGTSRNTVRKYLDKLKMSTALTKEEVLSMDNNELVKLFLINYNF